MKDKKIEEVNIKDRTITKDRLVGIIIGIFIGAIITAGSFCICTKLRSPRDFDNQKFQLKYRKRLNEPRNFDKNKHQDKIKDSNNNKETDKSNENSKEGSNQ